MKARNISPIFEAIRVPQMPADSGGRSWNYSILGVPPTRLYFGDGYSGGVWVDETGNDNLTLQAGAPIYNVLGPVPNVVGVKSDATAWFQGSSGPVIGTNDLIVAVAFHYKAPVAFQALVCTRNDGVGFATYTYSGTSVVAFGFLGAGGWVQSLTTVIDGNDYVVVGCINRDENSTNGMSSFLNGIVGDLINPYGNVASITDQVPLQINKGGGINPVIDTTIYAAGIWLGPNMFSSGATGASEMQAIASELTQRFAGVFPQRAVAGQELLTITRATESINEIERNGITQYFRQGNGLQAIDDEGLEIWEGATSILAYSSPDGNWTAAYVTDALSALDSPISGIKWTDVTETADDSVHRYDTTATWYFCSQNYYCSIEWIVKAGVRGILEFLMADANLGYKGNIVRVDTTTWTVLQYGIVGAGADAWWEYVHHAVRPLGNGAYSVRIVAKCIAVGGSGPIPVILGAVTDDPYTAPESYVGNNAAVAYSVVGGSVVTAAIPYYGPPIYTNGAAATRDTLDVNIDPDNIPSNNFTITGEFKLPDINLSDHATVFEFSDGTLNNRLHLGFSASSGYPHITIVVGGVYTDYALTDAGNVADGSWHAFIVAHENGVKTFLTIDDHSITGNHGKTLPAITTAMLGRTVGAKVLNGKARNIKIYNGFKENI